MSKRTQMVLAIALVVVLAAGVSAFLFLSDDQETVIGGDIEVTKLEPGTNAASPLAGDEATSLLYRSGRSLVLRGIEDAEDEALREVPTENVAAAMASEWIAFLGPEGSADAEARDKGLEGGTPGPPIVHVYNPSEGEEVTALGAGLQPRWDPTGHLVAFLRPLSPESCENAVCESELQVAIGDPETGDVEDIGEPGRYDLLDWAGDYLFLVTPETSDEVLVMALDGSVEASGLSASAFRDVAPDGSHLLMSTEDEAQIVPLVDGLPSDDEPIVLDGPPVIEGAWSHDSSKVAVVSAPDAAPGQGITVYDADSGKGTMVDQSEDGIGPLLWSPDNEALAFTHPVPLKKKDTALQAAYCPVGSGAETGCGFLFTWTRDVILLRLQ